MSEKSRSEASLELERIVFFTDAVTAIVATILVIELGLPDLTPAELVTQLPEILMAMVPKLASYALSFLVIGSFWVRHHSMYSHIRRYDYRLVWLNIMYLMFLALIPFATAVLGSSQFVSASVMLYSTVVSATAFLHLAAWEYAARGMKLIDESTSKEVIRYERWRPLTTALAFLLAVPLAYVDPSIGAAAWIIVPISFGVFRRKTSN
jgi:uncharacterized membrane protein